MQSPGGVLCKKGVHKKVCSVSRKALALEFLFFNKAADWRPAALSKKKKDSSTGVFLRILQNLQEQIF